MMKVDITQVLNGRLDCPRCHGAHGWVPMARAEVRQYSSIHRLRCAQCGEQIVAKMVGGRYSIEAARVHARKEYEALCALQSAFPQDARYGTLVPLAHLEYGGYGVVVTRLAAGVDLTRYVRTLDTAGIQEACRSSGEWLKRLHGSEVPGRHQHLGAAEKVSSLEDSYGTVLRGESSVGAAYEEFVRRGPLVDTEPVFAVRQHGDFKPDNMLCDGTRYIGLDIRWRSIGAPEYDLAPFLNHLWLDGRVMLGPRTGRVYDLAESAFLSGYGNVSDMRALRWVQLYFALCYMGAYRKQGRLGAGYASWKAGPLVRRLAAQVQETA